MLSLERLRQAIEVITGNSVIFVEVDIDPQKPSVRARDIKLSGSLMLVGQGEQLIKFSSEVTMIFDVEHGWDISQFPANFDLQGTFWERRFEMVWLERTERTDNRAVHVWEYRSGGPFVRNQRTPFDSDRSKEDSKWSPDRVQPRILVGTGNNDYC